MAKLDNDGKLALIKQALADKKAEDIASITIPPTVNSLFDIIVIASAASNRHLDTLADEVAQAFKSLNRQAELETDKYEITLEGGGESGWKAIAIDTIVVHILTNEVRETYRVEELWKKLLIDMGENIQ